MEDTDTIQIFELAFLRTSAVHGGYLCFFLFGCYPILFVINFTVHFFTASVWFCKKTSKMSPIKVLSWRVLELWNHTDNTWLIQNKDIDFITDVFLLNSTRSLDSSVNARSLYARTRLVCPNTLLFILD